MWPPDGRSEPDGGVAPSSGRILEEAAGVLPDAGRRRRQAVRNVCLLLWGIRNQRAEPVRVPVLQKVLGVLDLVLCPCDGDDAVLRAL